MAEPLIFLNTYRLKEGMEAEHKAALPEWIEFLESNHPRLLHFGHYVDEAGREAATVQVHPDAESMEFHMKLITDGDRVYDWQNTIEWDSMTITVFGEPSQALVEGMRMISGSGIPISFKEPAATFNRLPGM